MGRLLFQVVAAEETGLDDALDAVDGRVVNHVPVVLFRNSGFVMDAGVARAVVLYEFEVMPAVVGGRGVGADAVGFGDGEVHELHEGGLWHFRRPPPVFERRRGTPAFRGGCPTAWRILERR